MPSLAQFRPVSAVILSNIRGTDYDGERVAHLGGITQGRERNKKQCGEERRMRVHEPSEKRHEQDLLGIPKKVSSLAMSAIT